VQEFREGKDVEALFGEGVAAHDFNDDALLGRNLDRLFAPPDTGSWITVDHEYARKILSACGINSE
jgi:hypothetical protein